LSYARADDELPPNRKGGKGFVSCLIEQLHYEFKQLGVLHDVEVWRDSRKVAPGDQFDDIIEKAIGQSNLFVAVLSPNWMESDYCKKELESFRRRWQQEGELRVKQRIVVACKRFVDRDKRPSLLQGQQGYDFFVFESLKEVGPQFEFFARGEIRDDRYESVVQQLADFLYRRGQQVTRSMPIPQSDSPLPPPPPPPQPGPDARKIYLAKPASDMREYYSRLVQELSNNGYAVVPDPDKDVPHDNTSTKFIDAALEGADLSIHLLGDGKGYAPENSKPIVALQLTRAAARLGAATAETGKQRAGFRRIIWAPEVLDGSDDAVGADGKAADGGNAGAGGANRVTVENRLPLDVLARFGDFQPTDKVVGGTPSKFVDFLIEHLRQSDTQTGGATEITADDWIYVYHALADTQYACDLMDALKERGAAAGLPAFEGDPADVNRLHLERLSECSAVVLCWAQASEAWAHAQAHQLKDWKKLGRQKKFTYRGLLAGPPPGVRKTVFTKYPPANEIDIVVNLNEDKRPLTEAIDKFVHLAPPHAP
jgi:hypothetical protein